MGDVVEVKSGEIIDENCPECDVPMRWCASEGDEKNGCKNCWKCDNPDCALDSHGGMRWATMRLPETVEHKTEGD